MCSQRNLGRKRIDIKSIAMKGFITFPLFDGKDDWYVFIFTADDFEGTLIDSPEGKLEWITNDKLTRIKSLGRRYNFYPVVIPG